MAYDPKKLRLTTHGLTGAYYNEWLLDTTDAIATVNTSNYVSDGVKRGMNKGDIVTVRVWDVIGTGTCSAIHLCWVIDTGTGSDTLGVDLTDGLAITATDTD